jgi:hypothetical protein
MAPFDTSRGSKMTGTITLIKRLIAQLLDAAKPRVRREHLGDVDSQRVDINGVAGGERDAGRYGPKCFVGNGEQDVRRGHRLRTHRAQFAAQSNQFAEERIRMPALRLLRSRIVASNATIAAIRKRTAPSPRSARTLLRERRIIAL